MINISQYVQNKIKESNSEKIQWKTVVFYFITVTAYVLLLYLISRSGDDSSGQLFVPRQGTVIYSSRSPIPNILYSIIWPALSGLLLVMVGRFSAIKLFKIPKDIISVYTLVNLYFFSKLVAWLIGLPLICIGWFAVVPILLFPTNFGITSFIFDVYSRVIMPFYPWVTTLIYGTLLVTGIVSTVQGRKEKA